MRHRWQTETFRVLNEPLSALIGDKSAKPFAKLRVVTVGDLLHHVPRRYVSGIEESDLRALPIGEEVAVFAEVASLRVVGQTPRRRLEVELTDGRATIAATFFGRKDYLIEFWQKQLSMSRQGIFIGKVGEFNNRPQLTHPKFIMLDSRGNVVGKAEQKDLVKAVSRSGLLGFYPQTSALPTWTISATIQFVLDQIGDLADPLPGWVLDETDLPPLSEAFMDVHLPQSRDLTDRGLDRLRFDEALGLQLAMAWRRADNAQHTAPSLSGRSGGLLDALDARLPFTLTAGQQEVSEVVFDDLARTRPMQRLLQGEVGSGKTLVALRAMARAVDSGRQAVLLAPTEVLASQHADSIRSLLGDLADGHTLGAPAEATDVVLLTGSMPAAARNRAGLLAASGEAGIIIGTHAVLSDRVQFADLGLVIIDEQHRFGVEQRATLTERGEENPHQLVMTATPIPRSVAMTVFGDLETSVLREIPAGRAEVATHYVRAHQHPEWVDRAWVRIREEVAAGRQAFVVCSRISATQQEQAGDDAPTDEDAETMPEPVTVVDLAEELSAGPLAGLRVATLHSRMPADEKDATMAAFAAGDIDVLVATTVIEVGVNVPNASMMVVMDADRFGISQLHQLRGRIGRGEHPGVCLLISHAAPDSAAEQRLNTVAGTRDGFVLAEADLAARREGNILGASQAGSRSTLRLLRVLEHSDVIAQARDVAERLVDQDPDRTDPGLADMVRQAELVAAGDWLDRT